MHTQTFTKNNFSSINVSDSAMFRRNLDTFTDSTDSVAKTKAAIEVTQSYFVIELTERDPFKLTDGEKKTAIGARNYLNWLSELLLYHSARLNKTERIKICGNTTHSVL